MSRGLFGETARHKIVEFWVIPQRIPSDAYEAFWRPRRTSELCSRVLGLDLKLWGVMVVLRSGDKKVMPQQAPSNTMQRVDGWRRGTHRGCFIYSCLEAFLNVCGETIQS